MSSQYTLANGADWQGLYVNGVLMAEGHQLTARDAFAALGLSITVMDAAVETDAMPMHLSSVKDKVRA